MGASRNEGPPTDENWKIKSRRFQFPTRGAVPRTKAEARSLVSFPLRAPGTPHTLGSALLGSLPIKRSVSEEEPDGRLSSERLALCTQPTTIMRSHPRFFSQRLRSTRRRDTFPRLRYRRKIRTQSRIQDARHTHSAFCTEPHQQHERSTTLLRDAYSLEIS